MTRKKRTRNTTAAVTPTSKLTAPALGLEDLNFTHGNRKAEAEFGIVKSDFFLTHG